MNRLDEPVLIAVSKPLLTEFGIHFRFESCVYFCTPYRVIAASHSTPNPQTSPEILCCIICKLQIVIGAQITKIFIYRKNSSGLAIGSGATKIVPGNSPSFHTKRFYTMYCLAKRQMLHSENTMIEMFRNTEVLSPLKMLSNPRTLIASGLESLLQ